VIVAGFITAWLAVISNDGLVTDDYYKQGLTVNQRLQRDHQAEQPRLACRCDAFGHQCSPSADRRGGCEICRTELDAQAGASNAAPGRISWSRWFPKDRAFYGGKLAVSFRALACLD
jgi:hypothetical protein